MGERADLQCCFGSPVPSFLLVSHPFQWAGGKKVSLLSTVNTETLSDLTLAFRLRKLCWTKLRWLTGIWGVLGERGSVWGIELRRRLVPVLAVEHPKSWFWNKWSSAALLLLSPYDICLSLYLRQLKHRGHRVMLLVWIDLSLQVTDHAGMHQKEPKHSSHYRTWDWRLHSAVAQAFIISH